MAPGELERGGVIQAAEASNTTKSQQFADACKLRAEYCGISIEQLFRQEPELYEQYRRLVLEE